MVKSLGEDALVSFREAILKDYGVKLEGKELYDAAFNLLQFIEALIKFDKENVNKNRVEGSKGVQDNPLIVEGNTTKME